MRIDVYGLRGFPGIQGGVERHCEELYPRIASKDVTFKIFRRTPYIVRKNDKKYSYITFSDCWTTSNKYLETPIHSFISSLKIIADKPDIVHIHNIGAALTLPLMKLFGLKSVVTYHSANYEQSKWNWFARFYLKICEKIAFMFADRIIFVSGNRLMKSSIKKSKTVLIPNGVSSFSELRPNISLSKYSLKKDSFILTVGRIVPEKRFSDLIRAFSKIDTDMKLVIVGGSDNTAKYFKEISVYKKVLGNKLIFTGSLPSNDVKLLYENCFCFVLPSESEGMPIVLLEAMGFGKCPLVSNIEENLDVIKDYGYSFRVKDIKDLNRMLEYMLTHKEEVRNKGSMCKTYVQKHYNWDKIAKQTLEIYREILKK
ncbi:MAG: glycosyltransferase family 4 protein [Candidatus Woesearchaeota archaeon]